MPNEKPVQLEAVSEVRDLLTPNPTPQKQPTSLPQSADEYFNAAAEGADSPLDALTFTQVRAYFDASHPEHAAARALMGQPALSIPSPSSPATRPMPRKDSVESMFVEYLDRSQKYSADLERQQALAGQFTGADTGVGVPEMQPSVFKGAPVGTYGPPTKVPPLPSLPLNLEELRNFTGWNDPGFLESLLGASGWKANTVDVALKAFNAPFEALYNLIQNIPVRTEGEQAAREALAKATYIGALFYAPGDLGLSKGVKALNRAAREAKVTGEVAQRAAEIARGGK